MKMSSLSAVALFAVSPFYCLAATPPSQAPTTWEAPPESKQLQNPVKGDGSTVSRGKRLFLQHCIPCHGESGTGDGALAKKLGYKPADLTLERLNRQSDGEIFWKISKGKKPMRDKKPMPDWEKELTERERWDVVSYLRTLARQLQ